MQWVYFYEILHWKYINTKNKGVCTVPHLYISVKSCGKIMSCIKFNILNYILHQLSRIKYEWRSFNLYKIISHGNGRKIKYSRNRLEHPGSYKNTVYIHGINVEVFHWFKMIKWNKMTWFLNNRHKYSWLHYEAKETLWSFLVITMWEKSHAYFQSSEMCVMNGRIISA